MPYGDAPPHFFTDYRMSLQLVAGLRDYEKPTECLIFKVNPDGTKGKLLRKEKGLGYNGR